MKKFLMAIAMMAACIACPHEGQALENYAEVYPPIIQALQGTTIFHGDRHGQFEGDFVAHLSDGSAWKVHPDSADIYRQWLLNEPVRIKLRTDHYWFKREHKFLMYNHARGESVKVMLVQHIADPMPLQIISTETYAKSSTLMPVDEVVIINGIFVTQTRFEYQQSDWRKILFLSDGTSWVIKDKFIDFQTGNRVYIGAQGKPGRFYDFVMISGDQREAVHTIGRPQK